MTVASFNPRTLANMTVALDRVCEQFPIGKQEVRKWVAESILQCANSGKTTLGALTEAGERALAQLQSSTAKRCSGL